MFLAKGFKIKVRSPHSLRVYLHLTVKLDFNAGDLHLPWSCRSTIDLLRFDKRFEWLLANPE
jgi:hypothetical protein